MNSEALAKYSEAALTEMIGNVEREIAAHEAAMKALGKRKTEIYLAKKSLSIANFWKLHPELTPVNEGDKLAITEAFEDNREGYGGVAVWRDCEWIEVNSVYFLDDLEIQAIGCNTFILNGEPIDVVVAHIPVEIVSGMRKAYLESEKAK